VIIAAWHTRRHGVVTFDGPGYLHVTFPNGRRTYIVRGGKTTGGGMISYWGSDPAEMHRLCHNWLRAYNKRL
jgi:hypothetical protein